jgi:ubiquitin-protein ligase
MLPPLSLIFLFHPSVLPANQVLSKGGTFHLHLSLPTDYPFKPPHLNFKTKIYHPNVSNDDQGLMCLGLLRPDAWKPPTKIIDVIRFCVQVIREPNVEDAVEQHIAKEFREDRNAWKKTAREWTKKFANG